RAHGRGRDTDSPKVTRLGSRWDAALRCIFTTIGSSMSREGVPPTRSPSPPPGKRSACPTEPARVHGCRATAPVAAVPVQKSASWVGMEEWGGMRHSLVDRLAAQGNPRQRPPLLRADRYAGPGEIRRQVQVKELSKRAGPDVEDGD